MADWPISQDYNRRGGNNVPEQGPNGRTMNNNWDTRPADMCSVMHNATKKPHTHSIPRRGMSWFVCFIGWSGGGHLNVWFGLVWFGLVLLGLYRPAFLIVKQLLAEFGRKFLVAIISFMLH